MTLEKYRYPGIFYGLATPLTWAFWFVAAYLSYLTPTNPFLGEAVGVLIPAGLMCPALVALCMIWADRDLRDDFKRRLIGLNQAKPLHLFLTCFLMLGSILLAQAISLLFGYSADQFHLSGKASFSMGIISGWYALLLAPFLEELGWHTYGTDCLRRNMNLLKVCLLFAFYWALWHMPLGLVKGSYQSNLAETGLLHSLNYVVSFIAYVVLVNWLYYKTHRSVLVAIVFHLSANCSAEAFCTHPDSKIIQTALLLLLAIVLVIKDKDFFLRRQ
ncbi:MAG: CPBP family intramembrane metalloprotease [Verrucomicrobia bacterium]|nr:CPBP family intramembrane metalloprotease [Verrucomicrobiota bacterium]